MTTKEILNQAADILSAKHWIKGAQYELTTGEYVNCSENDIWVKDEDFIGCCLIGALFQVRCSKQDRIDARRTLNDGISILNISRWNDEVCKTHEEAVAKLRELANNVD